MFVIKKVLIAVLLFALAASVAGADIANRAVAKAENGDIANIGERNDLWVERAKFSANIRQDEAGNCYGPVYLTIKARGENESHAKLQMRMKPLNCIITENGMELDNWATVRYKVTQQGVRGITGISERGYFDYGIIGSETPILYKGEERVLIRIEDGKAQIAGQSFEIRDMEVTNYGFA